MNKKMNWPTELLSSLGITPEMFNYVNFIIEGKLLTQEYIEHVNNQSEVEAHSPHKRESEFIRNLLFTSHSAAKEKSPTGRTLVKTIQLNFLLKKNIVYESTWYLCYHLWYLTTMIDWRKNTGETIEDCLAKHKKNKPETYLDTIAQYLITKKAIILRVLGV